MFLSFILGGPSGITCGSVGSIDGASSIRAQWPPIKQCRHRSRTIASESKLHGEKAQYPFYFVKPLRGFSKRNSTGTISARILVWQEIWGS